MPKLSDTQIQEELRALSGWQYTGGNITKTFKYRDFVAAMGFVNQVALLAEKAFHHPDIDIRWNSVTLALATHDQGGITEKDFELAKQIEAYA